MAVGFTGPEDCINAALREIGYPKPVQTIYEGSPAARVALDVYGTARDFILQQEDWDFALREASLTPVVGGTLILGYTREYAYPSDALRIRNVHGVVPTPNYDPQPVLWTTGNDDTLVTPAKVIFTTISGAIADYIGQVTDPSTWNPGYSQALVAFLAKIFVVALKEDDANLVRLREGASDQTMMAGASVGDGLPPIPVELMARAVAAASRQ